MATSERGVPSLTRSIRLVGERTVTLTGADVLSLPHREREIEIVCSTGDRYVERWRGVPIPTLLERMAPPPETTHLSFHSRDGHRVFVDVETALDGLLAVARGGEPLSAAGDDETRFVAPGAAGPRTTKGVARIEAKTLAAGEEPEEYERAPVG